MVFLMETKLDKKRMEKVRKSCGLLNGIEVETEGTRGGLCLAWKDDIDVTLRSFSNWHLDVMVKEEGSQEEWRFTGLYGSPYLRYQNLVWNLLRKLSQEDHKRMEMFRDTLEECNLMNIGYSGVWYTWERGNLPETNIRERLDRGWQMKNGGISSLLVAFIISPIPHLIIALYLSIMITYGDRNTAYFHNCATARRSANSISKLILDKGQEINDESIIQEGAKIYFENLFTSKGVADPREILEGIEGSISVEINESLQAPFREDEVRMALKGMGPTKAPGPDGFPAIFFQKYWHIVGKEVLRFCLGVLNEGKEAGSANMTNIVLIPKVQSVFVPGRLISDNILLAYEILHTFRQKRTGKKGYMAVKLDMSKAYDKVEWAFLKEVMNKIGFASNWIELIMRCVTSVSYAVTINGNRGRIFKPTRGLRQVDPLSPFLFLIYSEGLSALMGIAKKKGLIRGAKASRKGPEISHLLFADDCLMFGEATEKGARVLKDILKVYENCSGQCVNFGKSLIFYNTNTNEESKGAVLRLLGVRSSSSPEKYLGLPNMVGRRKNEAFQNMGTLEKGLVWKVGTGAHILIRQDNLIPGYVNGRLLSRFDHLQYNKVTELISNNVREWNKDLIVNTFLEDVAELILRVPLSIEPHDDFLAWNGEPSGVFSVLHARRLGNSSVCSRCCGGEETLNHLFRECPVSAEIWKLLSDVDLTRFTNLEFSKWLTSAMVSLPLERCRLFCIALWSIWGDKNSRIHDKSTRSSQEIVRFINSYLQELDEIRINISKSLNENSKWQNPPENRFKINFDGDFDGRNKISASGVVVRDSRGNVISSSAVIHRGVQTAFEAEALACRRATQVALDMEKEGSIIEGDSLTVIKKCQNPDQDKSQLSPYIFDVHHMKSRDRSLKHEFTQRSANNLEHVLAVESLRRREEFYLLNRVPVFADAQARSDSEREPD
ncbi:reverse transcriptase [Gossypium australe]|uniref:Reverse transcriptase n=1 Tax=Gossypium australe TaxID=47621 RepID=A0A5B6W1F9_9ROSI|nr:reverse transcriptase [Gossypium australe]